MRWTREADRLLLSPSTHPHATATLTPPSVIYGWSIDQHWPFEVPLVLCVFVGFGNQFTMQVCNILLVDLFPQNAGAITACFNLTRCLLGAGVTGFINPLEVRVGLGWALVIVCGMSLAFVPALGYVIVKGPSHRARRAEEARTAAGRVKEEKAGQV